MQNDNIRQIITDFLKTDPENTLEMETGEPAWEEVLVGFSAGDDPLFNQYKEVVGEFHFTPVEIFNLTFPKDTATPEELTVISWVLIQSDATKKDNKKETFYPSERWARARVFGEKFNENLRKHLVYELGRHQVMAVAPTLSSHWDMELSDKYFIASRWSERHAAYASGLGTFGLCDGLITQKGKALRVGSVVARIKLSPTRRPYTDHHAYCLFYTTGKCIACARRCPVDAISEKGHDKEACLNHASIKMGEYVKKELGLGTGYGCGLCQTGVPCENGIPKAALR